ncbi:TRAP transporter small permease [uncultured Sneathiella sp.]|jgi:C4-dicarboxylate transporter DctQ subunit|uniref:TRAP transporter small permease n=1 Tax=uncultured Sneathiella sp. TaxID=879315 RepID=UPI0030D86AF9|tara:strand:- start:23575 stop:24255 length:681 start_codon:yes stop_codon:yes gene_type:complete
MSGHNPKTTRSFIDSLEETMIAIMLGIMTLVTFANVMARYVFNSNILWGLEVTSILFAWLVLFGVSYCVKKTAHLGVDAIVSLLSPAARKICTLLAVACCIIYAFLLLKGGWDFWANFANLPATTGRWFPTGFQEKFLAKGWYETNDVFMPEMFQFIADWFNDGERYEKIPRLIPYVMLPFGMALLLYRFIQAGWAVFTGKQMLIIVSHEAEDAVEEAAAKAAREE